MPVMIGKNVHLTRRDARDGLSNTEIRYLQARYRLCDGNTVEELAQHPAWVLYFEARALFRSRKPPFRMHLASEVLPEPNGESKEELLAELKSAIKGADPDVCRVHRIVCQMLANGF